MKRRAILLLMVYILTFIMPAYAAESELVNVSIHQQAEASSQLADENEPQMAVDGINDNASYTCWKSAEDDSLPWWQVDLNLDYEICRIEIEAPSGSAEAEEKRNFRITGSKDKEFKDAVVLVPEVTTEYENVFTADVTAKEKVRYVRIEKTKEGTLALGEVRVYTMRGGNGEGVTTEEAAEVTPVVRESETSELPTDVLGTACERDVALLSALGIMRGYEDGLFMPERQISRAEFTKVAVNLVGNMIKTDETTFADVPNGHWAHPYIETAVRTGLINGVGGGLFMPDEAITAPQVIKILVSVLGYGDFAEKQGGYPFGYQSVASEIDLYDGTDILNSDSITRGEVAQLVVNALGCDKLVVRGIAGNYIVSEVTKNETLLMKNFNIAKNSGIVTAAGGVSLTDDNPVSRPNTIQLDGAVYVTELEGLDAYLGMSVDYYYDMNETNRIVAVTSKRQNEVLTVQAEDLIDVDDGTLKYNKEDEERADFSKQADVIYNGVALRDYEKSDLLPEEGYVKLIDNDGDSVFDVYFIYEIKHYLVSWVNTAKETIYVADGTPIELDLEGGLVTLSKKSPEIENAAEKITLEELKENDVISVMASKNTNGAKVYNIVACDEYIEGILTGIARDTISIDGAEYGYTNEFKTSSVSVGNKYLFRLSAEGKIFSYDTTKAGEMLYGYLIAVDEENAIDETVKFKIFNDSGKIVVMNGAEFGKLYVDGYTYSSSADLINHLISSGKETGKLHQPIKYSVNGRGEVKTVDTISVGMESQSLKKNYSSGRRYYKSTGVIGMQFGVDDKTVMFKIPEDVTRENEFEIMTKNSLSHNSQYTMEAYDCGNDQIAGMLLFSGSTSSATAAAMLFMVDEVMTTVDSNGETKLMLKGLYKGSAVEYIEYEDGVINASDLKRGDVIGLTLSANDEIKAYSKKFYAGDKPLDADEIAISTNSPQYGNPYATIYYGYGKVMTKKDGMISIEYANSESNTYKSMLINVDDKNLAVYYYDKERDKIMLGNSSYILDAETVGSEEASHVMINVDSGDVKELIIFN